MCCHICRAGVGTAQEHKFYPWPCGAGWAVKKGVEHKGKVLLDQFFYRVCQESVVWLGLKGSR